MAEQEFSRAFGKSPMKRATLRGLERDAAAVLGKVGTSADGEVLARALDDPEPPVRELAPWALRRISSRVALAPLRARRSDDSDARANEELRSVLSALPG